LLGKKGNEAEIARIIARSESNGSEGRTFNEFEGVLHEKLRSLPGNGRCLAFLLFFVMHAS